MQELLEAFSEKYPELGDKFKDIFLKYPISKTLLSKKIVQISSTDFRTCVDTIKAFWELRCNDKYKKCVYDKSPLETKHNPKHFSMLMCFDFHITKQGPKLIEINTNAAFSIIAWLLGEKDNCLLKDAGYDELLREVLTRETSNKKLNIAIVDETPEKQHAYFEFHCYKILFENWGHCVLICDPKELAWNGTNLTHVSGVQIDFVYNRCCDFIFYKKETQHLKKAFLSSKVRFSPNPHEYNLLANKERFIDLSNVDFLDNLNISDFALNTIHNIIPKTYNITDIEFDELKKIKSNYIFKPKTMYGGKGVYRGRSISQTKLSNIYSEDYIAQEYVPAPKWSDYKYDLRIYTYRDDYHLIAARLYKGQVTNTRTDGGGLASVKIC